MRKPLPSRNAVLDLLGDEGRPVHAQEIATRLDVPPASFDGLLRMLDSLVFDGVLSARGQNFKLEPQGAKAPGDHRAKRTELPTRPARTERERPARTEREQPAPSQRERPARGERERPARGERPARDRREGVLTINPRGFGFVASPVATGDDVFVPAEALSGAMHGDKVIVEIVARGYRGAEGQIVEVKERGHTRVSGILRRRAKSAWVEPDDPRVRGPVVLTNEIDVRGGEGNSGEDGQVVVVQITRFPTEPNENPEGKLVAVLGAPGELAVEIKKILLLEKVEEVHSDEAIAEAEAYGLEVPEEMLAGREDLTHIPLPTIDPEDARDHDDAVWVERTAGGGYELWVAIADVSSYVRPGTKIDEEAQARGCSIYLPDRAIPMLPRALSSNLCSLLPDVIRLCLCVHAELDAKGNVKKTRLIRGFMRSAAKLTYGGVAKALGLTEEGPDQPKAREMVEGLRVAQELSRILRGKRMKRGALDFDLPEAVVKLAPDGKPISIGKRSQDPGMKKAYQLIEELMLFANETVAEWLLKNELPGVYRVHLAPDPKKLERLAAMCEALGVEFDVDETQTPKGLASLLKIFADHPSANVLNSLLLRSMKQATYDVSNLGHFGLASEAYLHFTSPIRRYPDLVVHRIVHAALEKDGAARRKALARSAKQEALEEAALASSIAERRAMEIERATVDVYRCFYMMDHIGERFEGGISAFVGSGAFVTIDDPYVDVLVRTEDMGGDWVIDDEGLTATSSRSGDSIRLGDRVMVEISDCAILRRSVYAWLVRGEARRGGERGERGERPGRRPFEAQAARGGRGAGRGDARRGEGRGGDARGGGEARGGSGARGTARGRDGSGFGSSGGGGGGGGGGRGRAGKAGGGAGGGRGGGPSAGGRASGGKSAFGGGPGGGKGKGAPKKGKGGGRAGPKKGKRR